MIELGKIQKLIVVKKVDFGVYLASSRNRNDGRKSSHSPTRSIKKQPPPLPRHALRHDA